MKIAMIGLGKMGGNMVRRLRRGGVEVVGYATTPEARAELAEETGMINAPSITGAIKKLDAPRIVWVMVPSGKPTEKVIKELELVQLEYRCRACGSALRGSASTLIATVRPRSGSRAL